MLRYLMKSGIIVTIHEIGKARNSTKTSLLKGKAVKIHNILLPVTPTSAIIIGENESP